MEGTAYSYRESACAHSTFALLTDLNEEGRSAEESYVYDTDDALAAVLTPAVAAFRCRANRSYTVTLAQTSREMGSCDVMEMHI